MSFKVEKEWVTKSGYKAVIIYSDVGHRCGYVAIPETNQLYKIGYSEQCPAITQEAVNNTQIGNKSPILIFTATCNSDGEDLIRRSPDVMIEAHGGLTYSSANTSGDYPIPYSNLWWFGYDCGHYMDDRSNGGQSLEYCINECEQIADQLKQFET